jgi:hypothetical protein
MCAGTPSLMDSRNTVEPIRKLAYRHIAGDDPGTHAAEPTKTRVLDKQAVKVTVAEFLKKH